MVLLKFIFLLFIALFIFILLMAFRFISTFRDNINKFNRRSGDFGRQQWAQRRRTYDDDVTLKKRAKRFLKRTRANT